MSTKRCPACNCIVDPNEHGNRNYCSDICYNYQKGIRNHKKYWSQVKDLEEFQKTDLILKTFFDMYGSEKFIPVILLDQMEMNWDIKKKVVILDDGQPAIGIGHYAYCLYIIIL